MRLLGPLDCAIGALLRAARWLALPLVLLLFAQWPLRDFVKGWSREANDAGQCAFALFVAASITATTRARAHLATDALAGRYRPGTRLILLRLSNVLALMPWALFVLVSGWPVAWASLLQLEKFPDTYNPGYFILKLAMMLAALLVLAQAMLDLLQAPARSHRERE